jgi:predicted amidohydrolase YtcJ
MTPLETEFPADERPPPGPVKVLLDDDNLPRLEWLSGLVSNAHRRERAVAVHCVTGAQLALTFAAFESAVDHSGAVRKPDREMDRIEHGAIIGADFLPLLAAAGLIVVTQPNFVFERGDEYLTEVDSHELPDLWRLRSLLQSGIKVAAGTDAPFGSPDPWSAVRASMRRLTRSGQVLGGGEAVDWTSALGLWLGEATRPEVPRRLSTGQPADIVLLREPLPAALDGDDPVEIHATLIGGELAFAAE